MVFVLVIIIDLGLRFGKNTGSILSISSEGWRVMS